MDGMNKRGQADGVITGIISAVLGIAVLGLILTYGADIVQTEHNNFNTGTSFTYNNRSTTFSGGVATLAGSQNAGANSVSVSSFNNFTNNTIGTSNFIVGTGTNFTVVFVAGGSQAGGFCSTGATAGTCTVNVSYSFNADLLSAAVNTSQDTLAALTAVSSRVDTLGTIIIVGGIISVLLGVFGGLVISRLTG